MLNKGIILRRSLKNIICVSICASAFPAIAQSSAPDSSEPSDIVVTGVQFKGAATPLKLSVDPASDTALVSSLSSEDIARQSLGVNVDIFRSIPGVQVGDFGQVGMAQGLSLRGWPGANDSSAVAFFLDGKQWNEASGAGANGYLDIAPIIPETIASMTVVKGPFNARYGGNFAQAGSAIATSVDSLDPGVSISGGSYGNLRLLGTYGRKTDTMSYYVAVQGMRDDGYRDNSDQKQLSTFSKLTFDTGSGKLAFSLQTYNIDFSSPGYISVAGVEAGLIKPTAAVAKTDGGKKNLYTLLAKYTGGTEQQGIEVTAYAEHNDRTRFVTLAPLPQQYNVTNREDYGLSVDPHFSFDLMGSEALLAMGASIRYDDIEQTRVPSRNGAPIFGLDPLDVYSYLIADIKQTQYAAYASLSVKPTDWLKITAGGRYDGFDFDVKAQNYVSATNSYIDRAADAYTGHFGFKGGFAIQPIPELTFIGNVGQSVASPDGGRSVPTNPNLSSSVLTTKELGVAFNPWAGRFHIAANYYKTKFTDEVTFVGPIATNQGESKRRGYDIDASAMAVRTDQFTLRLYGNYSYVHGRLQSGSPIPNVAKWVASFGLHGDYKPDANKSDTLLFDIGQQLTGPQPLDAPVTGYSGTSARLTTKLGWQMPDLNNLKIWADGIYYTKGRSDEFGIRFRGQNYAAYLPRFRFHVGASINF
ncbi:TonB-dependent receptor plug [Sphingobium chlorophenolicum L-1]|uniref:TonB-dependent receptor plug n=1 Tax=Sphingobium chlorophenolicum L-1 TaxID=690566 RepID=F6F3R1_SPHCR|nr:TonB-dependent receptor plug [Sphingobium chlorophenolicum L-1]